jgi:hypothetical protein
MVYEYVLQNMKSDVRNIRIYVQCEVCKLTLMDVKSAVCDTSSITVVNLTLYSYRTFWARDIQERKRSLERGK